MTPNDSNAPKEQVTYFIADLHLAEDRPDITRCFIDFLNNDAVKAQALYILGDLFESWIGDDDNSPLNNTVASALSALSARGTCIYYIPEKSTKKNIAIQAIRLCFGKYVHFLLGLGRCKHENSKYDPQN